MINDEQPKTRELIDWNTPGIVETLKDMWADGYTALEISKAIGHDGKRNSVIGKAKRLGLGSHPAGRGLLTKAEKDQIRNKRRKLQRDRERRESGLSRSKTAGPVRHKKPPRPDIVIEKIQERRASIDGPSMKPDYRFQRSKAWMALEGSQPVSLVDLERGQCKWPLSGHNDTHLFCALPVDADGKYCQTHHHLSHPRT